MVAGVSGLFKPPLPLVRGEEGPAGQLPIKQVGFLRLVAPTLDANVTMLLSNAHHFTQSAVEVIAGQVVQGVDGKNEVELSIFEGQ